MKKAVFNSLTILIAFVVSYLIQWYFIRYFYGDAYNDAFNIDPESILYKLPLMPLPSIVFFFIIPGGKELEHDILSWKFYIFWSGICGLMVAGFTTFFAAGSLTIIKWVMNHVLVHFL